MFALLLPISRLMCNLCFDKFELELNLCVAAQRSSCNISLSLFLAWLIGQLLLWWLPMICNYTVCLSPISKAALTAFINDPMKSHSTLGYKHATNCTPWPN